MNGLPGIEVLVYKNHVVIRFGRCYIISVLVNRLEDLTRIRLTYLISCKPSRTILNAGNALSKRHKTGNKI